MSHAPTGNLTPELAAMQVEIEAHARRYGLDFYPTIFELIDSDQLNAIAARGGFPTRYPHWRFGMEYEELAKGYHYGLQKIYEMVINNNPCYAYLMRQNAPIDQKLVMAHVYGHCDFFKNNDWFAHTSRKMMDEMANHGTRMRRYMDEVGVEEVEEFIDACLSVEDLIDVYSPFIRRREKKDQYDFSGDKKKDEDKNKPPRFQAKDYMDSFVNPREAMLRKEDRRGRRSRQAPHSRASGARRAAVPAGARPARRLAGRRAVDHSRRGVLLRPAGADEDHERGLGQLLALDHHDPRRRHRRRHHQLRRPSQRHDGQLADAAQPVQGGHRAVPRHRGPLEPRRLRPRVRRVRRPRERRRWDKKLGLGREKIFEVRRIHNDLTFIDEFLTLDFVRDHKLFRFGYNPDERSLRNREPRVSQGQAATAAEPDQPRPADHRGRRRQLQESRRAVPASTTSRGVELQMDDAGDTLENLERLWNRPVHIETVLERPQAVLVVRRRRITTLQKGEADRGGRTELEIPS